MSRIWPNRLPTENTFHFFTVAPSSRLLAFSLPKNTNGFSVGKTRRKHPRPDSRDLLTFNRSLPENERPKSFDERDTLSLQRTFRRPGRIPIGCRLPKYTNWPPKPLNSLRDSLRSFRDQLRRLKKFYHSRNSFSVVFASGRLFRKVPKLLDYFWTSFWNNFTCFCQLLSKAKFLVVSDSVRPNYSSLCSF